ncbi:MAG: hypothetical protein FJY97_06690 [candidate division Zixibacteria bacterium]|nr:hypothetical protein [candidate division Zixibacteria bacterium]
MKRYCPNCQFHRAWKLGDGRFKYRKCGNRYTFRSVWQSSRLPDREKIGVMHELTKGVAKVGTSRPHTARDRFACMVRMTLALHEHYCDPFQGLIQAGGDMPAAVHPLQPETGHMVLGLHGSGRRFGWRRY